MIVDVLNRLTEGVRRAIDEGHYRDFAASRPGGKKAPSMVAAVRADAPWAFLAEIKPASPTRGDLSGGDPLGRARERLSTYHRHGVTGLSILTERETFHGSLELLAEAAGHPRARPVLMKDFIIHPDQLDAAAAAGASCVLLIHHLFARGKATWELPDAIDQAHERGLEVLLEVDSAPAFEHAATTRADLIGINNRDLTTLEMDPDRAPTILRHRLHLVRDRPVLALSGIAHRADVVAMHDGGATGVLVGTSLMESDQPRDLLRRLRGLPHIKCCGTGHPEDGPEVLDALHDADAVGCVVRAGGAPRERTMEAARRLFAALPPDIERIIVTTDPDPVWLDEVIHATGATGIQIHSPIDPETLAAARRGIGPDPTLIALLRLPTSGDTDEAGHPSGGSAAPTAPLDEDLLKQQAEAARRLLKHADRLLLDAVPRHGGAAGGTGEAVDLRVARRLIDLLRPHPIVLAGGLDPDHVAEAIRAVRPWGVDVSSGIEGDALGRKDAERVRRFCREARTVLNLHDPPPSSRPLRVL